MNILVIGGCGYIGTKLVDFLKDVNVLDSEIDHLKKSNSVNYITAKYQDSKFEDTIDTNQLTNDTFIDYFDDSSDETLNDYKIIDCCRVCNTPTKSLLDLGLQPLANSYTRFDYKLDYNPVHVQVEDKYPLHLQYCPICFHVQLNCIVNATKLFKKSYNNNNNHKNNTLQNNFNNILIGSSLQNSNKVVTVGIDFFNKDVVEKLKNTYGKFDIITSSYIDTNTFLNFCKILMKPESTLYIQTNMIYKKEFNTVYHENLDYFNSNSMNLLCNNNGLYLNNITENAFEIGKTKAKDLNSIQVIVKEYEDGLYDERIYEKYNLLYLQYCNRFQNELLELKLNNYEVIGFGSTPNSNTLFNFVGITSLLIQFIIDENIIKQNLHTPGTNIFITDTTCLKTNLTRNTVILVIEWENYNIIKNKIKEKLVEYNVKYAVRLLNMKSLKYQWINK